MFSGTINHRGCVISAAIAALFTQSSALPAAYRSPVYVTRYQVNNVAARR